ncbi:hypothetical protein JCM19239_1475 [Vibrio variabilis]|uniref:Uncharacterized protein n=1 Tax=Vibrio variabilis TaxID=990271 RepID=A0ABQ0JG68_9VIBR|nr:hypothetical protein JCM19239_1475 [Vibrio variabilis]
MLLLVVAFVVMAIGVIFAVQLFTNTTQDTEMSQPTRRQYKKSQA